MNIVEKARLTALSEHEGQMYRDKPYSYHLEQGFSVDGLFECFLLSPVHAQKAPVLRGNTLPDIGKAICEFYEQGQALGTFVRQVKEPLVGELFPYSPVRSYRIRQEVDDGGDGGRKIPLEFLFYHLRIFEDVVEPCSGFCKNAPSPGDFCYLQAHNILT